jgi:hypothetical protein
MKLVPWFLSDSQNLCHRAIKKRGNLVTNKTAAQVDKASGARNIPVMGRLAKVSDEKEKRKCLEN